MDRRGAQLEHTFLDESRVMMRYRMPLGKGHDYSHSTPSLLELTPFRIPSRIRNIPYKASPI